MTAAIILFFASCFPGGIIPDPYIVDESRQKENIYYVPSAPNTPLLSEKNDFNFSLVRSSDTKFLGLETQLSYLPGKHIGITGSYAGNIDNSNDVTHYLKYNRFEVGSGYVSQLPGGWHFETYAGLGNGKITNTHYSGYSRINLTHFFLQPAIAISNQTKTVQFGFVSRFEGVNFKVTDTLFSTGREPFSTSQLNSLYDQPFHVIWEPALVFRFGWKNFKFHTGYSYSADLTNPGLYRAKNNFSIGLSFTFSTVGKEKPGL